MDCSWGLAKNHRVTAVASIPSQLHVHQRRAEACRSYRSAGHERWSKIHIRKCEIGLKLLQMLWLPSSC